MIEYTSSWHCRLKTMAAEYQSALHCGIITVLVCEIMILLVAAAAAEAAAEAAAAPAAEHERGSESMSMC